MEPAGVGASWLYSFSGSRVRMEAGAGALGSGKSEGKGVARLAKAAEITSSNSRVSAGHVT